jgi:hypothetical protein
MKTFSSILFERDVVAEVCRLEENVQLVTKNSSCAGMTG